MNRPTRRIAPRLHQDLTRLPIEEAARIAEAQAKAAAAAGTDDRLDPRDDAGGLKIAEEVLSVLREDDLLALAARMSDRTKRIVSHKTIRTQLLHELGRLARAVEAYARVQSGEVREVPIELQPLAAQRRIFDIFGSLFDTERFAAFFHGNYRIEDKVNHEAKTFQVLVHENPHLVLPPIPKHQQEAIKTLAEAFGVPNKAVADTGQKNSTEFLQRLAAIFLPPPKAEKIPTTGDAEADAGATFTPPPDDAPPPPPSADVATSSPQEATPPHEEGTAAVVEAGHPADVQAALVEG